MKKNSEFGKGLTYNLGLFLAHADRIMHDLEIYEKANVSKNRAYEMWFYGAADHLMEFIPEYAPTKKLKDRCKKFREKVLSLRLPLELKATKKDYEWAVREAKTLLLLIDKANKVPAIEGDYQ